MNFKPNNYSLSLLKKLSKLTTSIGNKFFYVIMGGFAVDGHAGKLTRNHPDVDILVFRSDIQKLETVLKEEGYPFKIFNHPLDKEYSYKIRTNDPDWSFTFQILDKKPDNKFEVSFYRNPHMIFPMSCINPPKWLTLEKVKFPAVSKKFLIMLKTNEITFFQKMKKKDPVKYLNKRKTKHLNCLHDIRLLKV